MLKAETARQEALGQRRPVSPIQAASSERDTKLVCLSFCSFFVFFVPFVVKYSMWRYGRVSFPD